jgi:hypothetical protein
VHLLAEPAAVHEHEPLAALGELVGELQRHAAAEGVADDGGPLHPQGHHEVPHAAGEGPERVVAPGLGRLAVAEQVGGEDGEALGEGGHDLPPRGGASGEAVDEDEPRPLAGHPVADVVAVDPDVAQAEALPVGHGDETVAAASGEACRRR